MADARIESQSFPVTAPLMSKVITAIKDWTGRAGIFGKEITPLPSGYEYITRLRFAPDSTRALTIWCEFPKGCDSFFLRCRTYVGEKNEPRVANNPNLKKHLIDRILEFGLLSNLNYCYRLSGDKKPYYWDFYDEIYFDGVTKDEFFRRYRKVGNIANNFIIFVWEQFFKQERDPATQKINTTLYL